MTIIPLIPFDQKMKTNIQIQASFEILKGILKLQYQVQDRDGGITHFDFEKAPRGNFGKELRKNEIWKNTCFEFFVKKTGNKNYYEFNSDSLGHWNFYKFTDYRSSLEIEEKVSEMKLRTEQEGEIKKLSFEVDLTPLFQLQDSLLFSFSSVINESGKISYWAHRHSSEKPDFHHVNNFTIEANFK